MAGEVLDFRVVDDDRVFLRAEFRRIVEEDAVDLLLRILELAAVEQEAADMDGEGSRDVQKAVGFIGIKNENGAHLFRVIDPDGIGEKCDVRMRFQIVAEVLAGGERL